MKEDSAPISEEASADASSEENPSPEAPKEASPSELDGGASLLEQAPVYRWTYADQVAHEAAVSTS
jgi:hypothetical protein